MKEKPKEDKNAEKSEKNEEKVQTKTSSIEDLPGVGPATAEKLREMGFQTVESIAVASIGELKDAGLTDASAEKIINAARENLKMGFETGLEYMEKRKAVGRILTGSKELDNLLGGGIETRSITEFYGQFSSGKTQIGLQATVNVQLPVDKGGLNGTAVFIDTEGTFRPERLMQMAAAKNLDPKDVLKNIMVARAYNSDHQILLAEKAGEIAEEKNVRLVVVDSLTSHFRSEYSGRGELASRQQKLNRHLHSLQRDLADMHNIAVIVTNQVMANPGMMFGDPTTPIGGNIVGHLSTYRIYLRKSKGNKRIARLVDSPCLPEGECVFEITANGIGD
ncbi:MAG: DNA repair and recombination protein RadA [Candidatus Altarchaeum sp.]|nr:DNA repair and recombination protein RadA [Candidatus Altarchaeum sp.]